MIKRIAILMAMEQEAQPLIESLAMQSCQQKIHPQLPMRCFKQQVKDLEIFLLVSGKDHRHDVDYIGSEAATLMAYEAITQLAPDLIISAGTAGGFASKGAEIGTVYLSEQHFIYHDRHVPLPGFDRSSIGLYPVTEASGLATALGLKQGVISTGSSLEKNEKDIHVINEFNAVAKEMEAAAIAWVAMLFNVPMIALKSITNLLDLENKSEQEFVRNLQTASNALHQKLVATIDYLQNKSVEDLV